MCFEFPILKCLYLLPIAIFGIDTLPREYRPMVRRRLKDRIFTAILTFPLSLRFSKSFQAGLFPVGRPQHLEVKVLVVKVCRLSTCESGSLKPAVCVHKGYAAAETHNANGVVFVVDFTFEIGTYPPVAGLFVCICTHDRVAMIAMFIYVAVAKIYTADHAIPVSVGYPRICIRILFHIDLFNRQPLWEARTNIKFKA